MTIKERPILFSGPMVRALLDGSKTQTRRIVKPTGAHHIFQFRGTDDTRGADEPTGEWAWGSSESVVSKHIRCPYGKPGDRLWVRESGVISKLRGTLEKPGLFRHDVPTTPTIGDYWVEETRAPGASYNVAGCPRSSALLSYGAKACPSIHMPRWASRITLEVTGVRVERLNDISEDDAKAEGCAPAWIDVDGVNVNANSKPTYVQGFARLWRDLNGDASWEANPWVWVVEFKRVT
jgi:hypothetical protein